MPRLTLTAPDGTTIVQKDVDYGTAKAVQRIATSGDEAALNKLLAVDAIEDGPERGGFQAGQAAGVETSERMLKRLLRHNPKTTVDLETILSQPEADVAKKVADIIDAVPEGRHRRALLKIIRKELSSERRSIERSLSVEIGHRQWLGIGLAAVQEVQDWEKITPKNFGRPNGSMLHKFRTAMAAGEAIDINVRKRIEQSQRDEWERLTATASVFLVQHNWATAFSGAADYVGGEIRLPDEACVFEFRINDRHVLMFAIDIEGTVFLQHAVQTGEWWVLADTPTPARFGREYDADNLESITTCLVRAVCIALDAEIATTDVVRAPHKLNRVRERAGKAPLSDFHVVNLARRSRPTPLPSAPGHEATYRVRLHFRRGHWRHYADHKTWIKWMLVGDPDLGFVDKEYRL